MGAFLLNIVLWLNNYYTYRFPEADQVFESSECKAKGKPRT